MRIVAAAGICLISSGIYGSGLWVSRKWRAALGLAVVLLFPSRPTPRPLPPLHLDQGAPKLRVAIVGGGLAGLSTAVELLDQGHEVDIYEGRQWVGGKVASFTDKDGNHIEVRGGRGGGSGGGGRCVCGGGVFVAGGRGVRGGRSALRA
jgi:hypothetical protein